MSYQITLNSATSLRRVLYLGLFFLLLTQIIAYSSIIQQGTKGILYADYGKFYQSARFVIAGKDIYTPVLYKPKTSTNRPPNRLPGNLNPPFFTLFVLPLGYLSYSVSLWAWSLFSIACGILSIVFVQKALQATKPFAVTTTLAFFTYFPTFSNIHFGQVTLFLMPLITGAWLAMRREKPMLAAVLLAIAASLKPFLGLFFLYYLLRREWKPLVLFCSVGLICLLIPLLLFGKQTYINYLELLNHIRWTASSWNASLLGFVSRLFGNPHELNTGLVALGDITKKTYWLLSAIFLLGISKYILAPKKIGASTQRDFDFSVILIASILLSPLGWFYYFSLLIIPIAILWELAKQNYYPTLLSVGIAIVIILSSLPAPLLSPEMITTKNALGIFLWSSCYTSSLFILIGLFIFLTKRLPEYIKPPHENFSNPLFVCLISIALLFSLCGLLKTPSNILLYGNSYIDRYTLA